MRAYDLIRKHSAYFENLFDALGYRLVGRPVDRYVGLIANELPARQSMKRLPRSCRIFPRVIF